MSVIRYQGNTKRTYGRHTLPGQHQTHLCRLVLWSMRNANSNSKRNRNSCFRNVDIIAEVWQKLSKRWRCWSHQKQILENHAEMYTYVSKLSRRKHYMSFRVDICNVWHLCKKFEVIISRAIKQRIFLWPSEDNHVRPTASGIDSWGILRGFLKSITSNLAWFY